MKAFTERNPLALGAIAVVVILGMTAAAFLLTGDVIKSRYTVTGRFADAAGLESGAQVRLAGVPVGKIGTVAQAPEGQEVDIDLNVDSGTEIPADSTADIIVETLLGVKYVRIVPGNDWDDLLEDGDVITDTTTPFEVTDLQDVGTPIAREADGAAFNNLLRDLAEVVDGKETDVQEILEGLDRLAVVINDRETEARNLVDSARTLTATLAERDQDVLAAVDDLNVVLSSLATRRDELDSLLESTARTTQLVAEIIGENRPELDAVLDELHADLQIVGRHQVDLAQALTIFSQAAEGFASAFHAGPDRQPVGFLQAFAQFQSALSPDVLLGSCGTVDLLLDRILPADPLPCAQRTGPLPTQEGASGGPAVPSGGDLGPDPVGTTNLTALYGMVLP